MKRIHLGLALFFVIVLIGGTTWNRIAQAKRVSQKALAVVPDDSDAAALANANAALDNLTSDLTPATTSAPVNLTDTDLISRQLLSDYIDMSANGQATDQQISGLADQYASQISSLSAAPTALLSNIAPVSNNGANFSAYAEAFTKIEQDYAAAINGAHPEKLDLSTLGPDFYSFTATFGKAYMDAAARLEKLPVPAALVADHLKLINLYLSSGTAMQSMSHTEHDPMVAFSGMMNLNNNLQAERDTASDIGKILTDNGQ